MIYRGRVRLYQLRNLRFSLHVACYPYRSRPEGLFGQRTVIPLRRSKVYRNLPSPQRLIPVSISLLSRFRQEQNRDCHQIPVVSTCWLLCCVLRSPLHPPFWGWTCLRRWSQAADCSIGLTRAGRLHQSNRPGIWPPSRGRAPLLVCDGRTGRRAGAHERSVSFGAARRRRRRPAFYGRRVFHLIWTELPSISCDFLGGTERIRFMRHGASSGARFPGRICFSVISGHLSSVYRRFLASDRNVLCIGVTVYSGSIRDNNLEIWQ